MTLKKFNKREKGQSVFEYFILTAVVVTVVLFFASSRHFQTIKDSCTEAFNQGIEEMLK